MIVRCLYDELVPVHRIRKHPKNRNNHPKSQVAQLAEILKDQGIRRPARVSKQSGYMTVGHGMLMAIEHNGWTSIPVNYQDYDSEEQEYADVQADNAIGLQANLDIAQIKLDIKEMPQLKIATLGIKGLKAVEAHTRAPVDGEDDVPDSAASRTQRGQIWQLGDHSLMCGSSTMLDDVKKLLNGEKADITFTSPPYNVGRTPNGDEQKYENDSDDRSQEEFVNFLYAFTSNALSVSDFVFVNIQSLAGNKVALIEWLHQMRGKFADTLIWDKLTAEPAMAKNVLNSRFEYVHIFSHTAKRVIGKKEFRGTLENVFQFNSRKDKEYANVHKATFPVAFAEHFVDNFVDIGGSVYEPFAGTGTTAIAAEKLKRRCFMMEIDPGYCDIIIARYEKFTGKEAQLISQP